MLNQKEKKQSWWNSPCCFKRKSDNRENIKDAFGPYDYIVEKLIVQRIPLGLLKTTNIYKENSLDYDQEVIPSIEDFKRKSEMTCNSQISNIHNESTDLKLTSKFLQQKTDSSKTFAKTESYSLLQKGKLFREYISDKSFPDSKLSNKFKEPTEDTNTLKNDSTTCKLVAPVEVHYRISNLKSEENKSNFNSRENKPQSLILNPSSMSEKTFEKNSSLSRNKFVNKEEPDISKNEETTLRWKIIIKHKQPNSSEKKEQNTKSISLENILKSY